MNQLSFKYISMKCPLFVDLCRECIKEIEVYPEEVSIEILDYCGADKHKECPFYKMLVTKKDVCKI